MCGIICIVVNFKKTFLFLCLHIFQFPGLNVQFWTFNISTEWLKVMSESVAPFSDTLNFLRNTIPHSLLYLLQSSLETRNVFFTGCLVAEDSQAHVPVLSELILYYCLSKESLNLIWTAVDMCCTKDPIRLLLCLFLQPFWFLFTEYNARNVNCIFKYP